MLSGVFPQFFLLLYPTCQRNELWVISLGKVCREAGSWRAAVKRSNWAFNHADILTALNLSWECASESVRAGLWLDHQDATPDRSRAEWDEAGNGRWWGKSISQWSQEFDGDSSANPGHPDWRIWASRAANGVVSVAVGCRNIKFNLCFEFSSWCKAKL